MDIDRGTEMDMVMDTDINEIVADTVYRIAPILG
jgi:hypothetical protein